MGFDEIEICSGLGKLLSLSANSVLISPETSFYTRGPHCVSFEESVYNKSPFFISKNNLKKKFLSLVRAEISCQ